MVVVLEHTITEEQKSEVRSFLSGRGFKVREIQGEEETILGAVGSARIDLREVEVLPGVLRVIPISKPYKLASREFKKDDTLAAVGSLRIGSGRIAVIAGPCSVESRDQILESAHCVRESGAVMLRGGAFKPRTSPYAFQGLGEQGLSYLKEAGEATGMPVVSEIVSPSYIDIMRDRVDVFQIGARNMQNFELLKSVGASGVPALLKRGLSATIEEWLMAAEYLLAHGAEDVILCERGIRTFETYTRNSLDISSIPVVKKLSHLPVLVDPSHATGLRDKVMPVALGAIAAGADGLIVEVHPDPDRALSDGPQSLFPAQFERLMRDVEALAPVVEKEMLRLPIRKSAPVVGRQPRELAGALSVAFQGERGAYSEIALKRYFQNADVTAVPNRSFREVFTAVLEGTADYGIVPLENSLSGSIHENYDLFLQFPDIAIAGEVSIRIIHSLIAKEGTTLASITRVFSHPQGLAQCAGFLAEHPEWQQIPYYDTAGSVAHVAEMEGADVAAIANSEAASTYGLTVLKEGIEGNPQNYTRFAVLARSEHAEVEKPDKASVVFATPDKPGALLQCMDVFSRNGVNLTKIESRPILGKPWEYMFYLDMDLRDRAEVFDVVMEELAEHTDELRVLGRYRKA
ncbi:MAG: 3-deoxy-7-phosphoheptulonate synthase [Spirochaetes bacterium]|jgi:3-deoxy-7-phosphoheptulonate synthase|nr:3-deoxy-7-phosphoheptulonate synthase [Spirochaetota bacterium]